MGALEDNEKAFRSLGSAPRKGDREEVRNDARLLAENEKAFRALGTPAAAPPGTGLVRGVGLASRATTEGVIEGLGGLPALALDAGYNLGAFAGNRAMEAFGAEPSIEYGMPVTGALSRTASRAADVFRTPQPESNLEKNIFAATKGGVSALTSAGGSGAVAGAAKNVAPRLAKAANVMASAPGAQTAAGATAGGVTELTRQHGVDPVTSTAAGIGAGVLAGSAPSIGRTVRSAARPFTTGGRENIVGKIIAGQADDHALAAKTAAAAPEYVPGSKPTTGAASRDAGLLQMERALERDGRGGAQRFALRKGDQLAAQRQYLDDVIPDESAIARQSESTKKIVDGMVSPILDTPAAESTRVDLSGVAELIVNTKKSRHYAYRPVKAAVDDLVKELSDRKGRVTPGELYSIRKNITDAQRSKFPVGAKTDPGADVRTAYRNMKPLVQEIDKAIDDAAPGFLDYMEEAARLNKKLDANEISREIYNRSLIAGVTDPVSRRRPITVAKLRGALRSHDTGAITPEQRQRLHAVLKDLDRNSASTSSTLRPAGSDTQQNMSASSVLSALVGRRGTSTNARTIPIVDRTLHWVYSVPDEIMYDMLVQAMLDPKAGAALMAKADKAGMIDASSELARVAAVLIAAQRQGALGSSGALEITVHPGQ